MTDKIYRLMNWPKIEEIIYSECSDPFPYLGPHKAGLSRLVQCYYPGSSKVIISWGSKQLDNSAEMELVDEGGYYAALIPAREKISYKLNVFYEDRVLITEDPYRFEQILTQREINRINSGKESRLHQILGAHRMTVKGVDGVYFAVFAPNAIRASVVADFNNFDGRVHQMRRVQGSALYEIFIPGVVGDFEYAFELKEKGYKVFVKADPFAGYMTADGKCRFVDEEDYTFSDSDFLRASNNVSLIKNCKIKLEDFAEFYLKNEECSYSELAEGLIEFCRDFGYTHIEIQDALSRFDSNGEIAGYFSVNTRFGNINGFKNMVDLLHLADINVVLAVNYAYYSNESYMKYYEGCALFEHPEEKIAIGYDGNHNFNYERNEVLDFFVSNLFFIAEDLRCDGVKYQNISRMIYMDYGKKEGQFVRNSSGGTTNLSTVSAIRYANECIKKYDEAFLLIADIDGDIPLLTDAETAEGGYGFDLKESKGFYDDIRQYFKKNKDASETSDIYASFVYAYAERFSLSFDSKLHREICTVKSSRNFRLALAYLYMYPGQKSLYFDRIMMSKENREMISDLNSITNEYSRVFAHEEDPKCFEWVNFLMDNKACITFLKKTADNSEILFGVINTDVAEKSFSVPVPFEGKYKEIFSSENISYGGVGAKNIRVRYTGTASAQDKLSINLKMPAESLSIFRYSESEK